MPFNFDCIDAHTCGNPVRLVATGVPPLEGDSMAAKRLHFIREFDWIRRGLMFEPRGHDMMSGSMLFPPQDPANDTGVLFIETSGCLPMCGHGLIGTVTIAIEKGLVKPRTEGKLRVETPAGLVVVEFEKVDGKVNKVRFTNVVSFLHSTDLEVEIEGLGRLKVDVSYGGNFYAIVDRQENFPGFHQFDSGSLVQMGRELRRNVNEIREFVHPVDKNIHGCSHVLWTDHPVHDGSHAANAVLYGEKGIDRSPCGTGTSARMAQWYAKGKLKAGDPFVHESIIGSRFTGVVEEELDFFGYKAIRPSVEGWAKIFGRNTITIDLEDDPYAHGFQVI
jgi:4-hydroxyproline epimerase